MTAPTNGHVGGRAIPRQSGETLFAGDSADAHEAPVSSDYAQGVDVNHRDEPVHTDVLVPPKRSPGKRKASRRAGSRSRLLKVLPSSPALLGAAVLVASVGGALYSSEPELAADSPARLPQAIAIGGGSSDTGSVRSPADRDRPVSRDYRRGESTTSSSVGLVAEAERQARRRDAALNQLAELADTQASKLAENRWVLPLSQSIITATFGEYGLWSSYHTGLDFNGNTGDPIMAIANGTITETGYDGAYGNKTVLTLGDGTELWFCHQNDILVQSGETVTAGEVIGTVGTTGNVTGSHLHVEVRPGGGDPVDPYAAFIAHGVTP